MQYERDCFRRTLGGKGQDRDPVTQGKCLETDQQGDLLLELKIQLVESVCERCSGFKQLLIA